MRKWTFLLLFSVASAFGIETLVLSDDNTVVLRGPVSQESASKVTIDAIIRDNKLEKGKPLFLVLDTPGGDVISGNLLIDSLRGLNRPINTVTIFAASMGYHTVQSLGKRYIVPSGTLMSHRAAVGGIGGQIPGEANSRIEWLTGMANEMDINVAKRLGIPVADYRTQIQNELWLTANTAIATNNADVITNIKCDKSLQGVESVAVETFFGSFKATFSKCPLVAGPLNINSDPNVSKEASVLGKRIVREMFDSKKMVRKQ